MIKAAHISIAPSLAFGVAVVVGAATAMFSQTPASAPAAPANAAAPGPTFGGLATGRPLEKITVHGKSLEGNLEGDSPDRDVYVYLPPSYTTSAARNRRYPVVYFLHGYGAHATNYINLMHVAETADKKIADGTIKEMILVFPDAYTIYNGSMYSSSLTTGDWEVFLTEDLVSYIDGHYRTLATRASRGLAGHSMGGYGSFRIGMKFPDVYSSLYPMSSCCLMNNPFAGRGGAPGAVDAKATKQLPPVDGKGGAAKGKGKGAGFANAPFAQAAAWAPNPMNPPQFFDLPTKDGQVQPAIAAKYLANSPLAMVDQYVTNLKKYKAIMMDVGLQDNLAGSNRDMDESLKRLGVAHTFETYEGDHTNHVRDRFAEKLLPFFSTNLEFTSVKKK